MQKTETKCTWLSNRSSGIRQIYFGISFLISLQQSEQTTRYHFQYCVGDVQNVSEIPCQRMLDSLHKLVLHYDSLHYFKNVTGPLLIKAIVFPTTMQENILLFKANTKMEVVSAVFQSFFLLLCEAFVLFSF